MKLHILSGSLKHKLVDCDQTLSIGRSSENNIYLSKRNISRFHAEIYNDNGYLVIKDLESRVGVFINDRRIDDTAPLKENDDIRIGDYEFKIVNDDFVVDPALIREEQLKREGKKESPPDKHSMKTDTFDVSDIQNAEKVKINFHRNEN